MQAARCCCTIGAANITKFIDVPGGVEATLSAPYPGAGVVFDGRARGYAVNDMTRLLHAGVAAGMPRRLQLVFDYSVFDAEIWNAVMAELTIQELADRSDVDEDAKLAAMRALQLYLPRE